MDGNTSWKSYIVNSFLIILTNMLITS